MFNDLIESKRKKDRSLGGTLASGVLHAILIVLAVVVTANAGQKIAEKNREEDVKFVQVKPKTPPPEPEKPKPPPPKDVVVAPPPPKGFQVLTAPIKIPDKIPDVDLSKAVTNAKDFSGIGVAGGRSNGVEGGTPVNTQQTYYSFQVEKQTQPVQGNPNPVYPSMLESARVDGEVLAQFVVDTAGRADMSTFKVLKATNELFVDAVKRVLPKWHFYPAETGGHKVKQLVQMPFTFTVP
jgi:protein TonB